MIELPATPDDGYVLTVAIPVGADEIADPARHAHVVARATVKARQALDEMRVMTEAEWNQETGRTTP